LARTKAPDCPGRGWVLRSGPLAVAAGRGGSRDVAHGGGAWRWRPWRRSSRASLAGGLLARHVECRPWPASRDVIRAWSCRGWAPWTMPATSAVARSAGPARRAPPGSPGQHGGSRGCPAGARSPSPPPMPGAGGVAGDGGGWADQAAQQKLNAHLTRTGVGGWRCRSGPGNLRWPRDGGSRRSSVTESNSIFVCLRKYPPTCRRLCFP
jgi:hypothetical protein